MHEYRHSLESLKVLVNKKHQQSMNESFFQSKDESIIESRLLNKIAPTDPQLYPSIDDWYIQRLKKKVARIKTFLNARLERKGL
jgi:hypothetical protein